ncbi:nitroreductase [Actinoplanes sp. KI2]|uniref:Acg family FMN-binding oxidoreductase n=1 Tax=Actinoplanes sp. KI2 TaxID=2983315 RepID=UPI0021D5D26E|nr:nitroreductase [Actinoplanes sp. KI2]MCU7726959.1 nitroreductase [Actinoplanes sp. KI2]
MTALEDAARAAQHAPSVFNTQPWSWRITGDTMELYADPSRQLEVVDKEGRLLLLSCGTALHHARVALAAAGVEVSVSRDVSEHHLATIHVTGQAEPASTDLAAAIRARHSDRRAFGERPVAEEELTTLRRLVEAEGAFLHVVRPDQIVELAISAEQAGNAERDDPAYQAELARWTSRPDFAGDGVPPETGVRQELRRVPIRDFDPSGEQAQAAGAAHDQGTAYVILFGRSDTPVELLRGGEALSALLLRATADGLSTSMISDTIEVEWPRTLVRGMISGIGEPYVVVRLGYLPDSAPPPSTPRRDPRDVITVVEQP